MLSRRSRKLFVLVLALINLSVANAFADPNYPSLQLKKLAESTSGEAVTVGGRTVVGIGVAAESDGPAINFSTWAPSASEVDAFCLNITTQSGNYYAQAYYLRDPDDQGEGPRQLPYDLAKPENVALLEELRANEMGLLVESTACDDVVAGPYLLSAWLSEISEIPKTIDVMINSRSSDQVAVEIYAEGQDQPRYGRCESVPAGTRQGFDRICKVDLHIAPKQTLVVTTFGFGGERNPPVEAEILSPQ